MNELDIWLRYDTGVRDFAVRMEGKMKREIIPYKMLVRRWEKLKGKIVDIYASVFSVKQYSNLIIDTIFLDIDETGRYGYDVMKYVVRRLESIGIKVSRVYYSGRGYHIYLDFNHPIVFKDRIVYRKMIENILVKVRVDGFVDWAVVGDVKRLARLPESYNSKTGAYMIRINPEWDYGKIMKYAGKGKIVQDIDVEVNDIEIFDEYIVKAEKEYKVSKENMGKKIVNEYFRKHKYDKEYFPECMKSIMRKLSRGEGTSHSERIHLASFLILIGWDDDEIVEVFRNADDFDERMTRYQIEHLRRGRYNTYSCSRALREGFCVDEWYEKCPYKPLRDWVRWLK